MDGRLDVYIYVYMYRYVNNNRVCMHIHIYIGGPQPDGRPLFHLWLRGGGQRPAPERRGAVLLVYC